MYTKKPERAAPGCIIFLVDQSFSMIDSLAGSPRAKIDAVAAAINRFIGELIIKCERGEDKPRPYFDIGALGYTTDKSGNPIIGSLFSGVLAGRDVVSIVDLFDNPLDVENRKRDDGQGGLVDIKFPVWYRKPAEDQMAGTPMSTVLQRCYQIVSEWCANHQQSFPPIVINLTDGESTDGDPEQSAQQLQSVSTQDGNVLLFNCHLSSSTGAQVLFPDSEERLEDPFAKILFRMSSPLPEKMREMAEVQSISAPPGARAMAFNIDGTGMLQLINVGTDISTQQLR